MRKILWMVMLLGAFSNLSGVQDASSVVLKADQLIAEHKYMSAFDALGTSMDDVEIVLKKFEILMGYYVNNIHYMVFSLMDIGKDESIQDYRGKAGNFRSVVFNVDEVLAGLLKKHPDNGKLHKVYGEYFHAVLTGYGELPERPRDLILREMEANSLAAKRLGSADATTNFIIGLARLYAKDYAQAVALLEECVQLDPNKSEGHYNLGYALMFQNRQQEALLHALRAYELYTDEVLKADAAIMAGQLYWEIKDTANSVKYYNAAGSSSTEYRILKTVLSGLLKNGAMEDADRTAEKLLALQPTNPTLPQEIIQMYSDSGHTSELIGFFERMENRYESHDESAGNVLFHKAHVHIQAGETQKARLALAAAKARFQKCFSDDHKVFRAIEEMNKKLKDKEQ